MLEQMRRNLSLSVEGFEAQIEACERKIEADPLDFDAQELLHDLSGRLEKKQSLLRTAEFVGNDPHEQEAAYGPQ